MRVVPCATLRDGGRLVPIEHWATAGLARPGGFQPRIAEVEVRDCTEVLGHLAAEDRERLENLVARLDPALRHDRSRVRVGHRDMTATSLFHLWRY